MGLRKKRAPTAKIGKAFEDEIVIRLGIKGFTVLRIPDGCKQLSAFKLIRVRSPFDFVAHKKDQVIFFDAKTTDEKNFPYSKINQTQLQHLLKLEMSGFKAGYVIKFNLTKEIVFVTAGQLLNIKGRQSIKEDECERLFL